MISYHIISDSHHVHLLLSPAPQQLRQDRPNGQMQHPQHAHCSACRRGHLWLPTAHNVSPFDLHRIGVIIIVIVLIIVIIVIAMVFVIAFLNYVGRFK